MRPRRPGQALPHVQQNVFARNTGRSARLCGVQNGITGMAFEKVTMMELAGELSRSGSMIDRGIVDRTGLAGTFDATLGLGFLPAAIVLTRYPASGMLLEPLGVRSLFRALPNNSA